MSSNKFYYRKSYLIRSVAITVALFSLALYMIFSNPDYDPRVAILFIIIIALYSIKSARFLLELANPRPVIEIGPEGILDRRSIGKLPLPWSAIATIILMRRPRSVAIVTNDERRQTSAETLISRMSNFLRRKFNRGSAAFLLTPPLALDADHDQIIEALKTHATSPHIRFQQ